MNRYFVRHVNRDPSLPNNTTITEHQADSAHITASGALWLAGEHGDTLTLLAAWAAGEWQSVEQLP